MELRDIEVFLTLADELHFGRTAERLHLTTARVSQVVKKAERRVGGVLFERTSRHVALTPLGKQLRDELASTYSGLQDVLERAGRTARGATGLLKLGMLSWKTEMVRPALGVFARERPDIEVRIRSVGFADPFAGLRSGDIDAAVLWLPVREPDLTVGPLVFVEPILLAMSASHRLATRTYVSLEDLADEVVMGGAYPAYWRDALVPHRTPGGRTIPVGPTVTTFEEMLPILATGEAISPVHAHAAQYARRPDVVYRPIRDAPAAKWALVWRTATSNDVVRDFAAAAASTPPRTELPQRPG
ncbi:LysR family transcriptional regulator [Nocardia cyriacigeorgica]|uniref:LysR family transcriptional regulator n=1 Tax=Nocardia cyriacigeorgica TaxID=135487 RepID=UPI00245539E5|nr:LysR family transcriptional regulator [Nocardia cyriacigeorgica]